MEIAAKANLLRVEKENLLRMALDFEVSGKRKKGCPKTTSKGYEKDVCKKFV